MKKMQPSVDRGHEKPEDARSGGSGGLTIARDGRMTKHVLAYSSPPTKSCRTAARCGVIRSFVEGSESLWGSLSGGVSEAAASSIIAKMTEDLSLSGPQ